MTKFKPKQLMSTGYGESRTLNAPPEEQKNPYGACAGCTIAGRPVEDVVKVEDAHLLHYDQTDQGIAARNEGRSESRVEITESSWDKIIAARAEAAETWESPDPVKDVVAQYVPPGMRPKLLSDPVVNVRGMRGWKPVIGKHGDPVKVGTMVLAVMPEERARKRNEHYRDLAKDALVEATEGFAEKHDRLLSDSRRFGMDIRPLRPGELVGGSTAEGYDQRSQAGEVLDAPRGASIGLRSTRGNSAEILEG